MSEPTEAQRAAARELARILGPAYCQADADLIARWLAQREQAAEGLAQVLRNIGSLLDFAQRDNTADTLIVTSLVAIRIVNEAEAALAQWEERDK